MILIYISQSKSLFEEVISSFNIKNTDLEGIRYRNNFNDFFLEFQRKNGVDLFGRKKTIILHNLEELKEREADFLCAYLKQIPNNFIVFSKNRPKIFLRSLQKYQIDYKEKFLQVPKGIELNQFLSQILKKYQINLPPSLFVILKENYKDNFDLLLQEVKKISFLGKDLQKEDVINLLNLQANIFTILKSLLNQDYLLFLRHFYKYLQHIRKQDEIIKFIGFLANSLWRIAIYKTNANAKLQGNIYYLNELKSLANNVTYRDLQKILNSFAQAERKLKRFQIKIDDFPREVVYGLIN